VHYIGETEKNLVHIGQEVEAVFKDAVEREGSILDITHFRPASE
jgi:uncharacterized OB-fold protein